MSFIDHVQHRLTHQVIADRQTLQVVPLEQFAFLSTVVVVRQSFVDLEVISPTRQLHAVVAELGGLASHFRHGQVGPLASEEGNRSCHDVLLLVGKR